MNGAILSVLDENGNVLHSFDPITGAQDGQTFTFTLPATITASAIRVDNDDEDHLQIAEIDIFGPVPAGFDPTGLTVHNGGTVHDTTPAIDTSPDNDTSMAGRAMTRCMVAGAMTRFMAMAETRRRTAHLRR